MACCNWAGAGPPTCTCSTARSSPPPLGNFAQLPTLHTLTDFNAFVTDLPESYGHYWTLHTFTYLSDLDTELPESFRHYQALHTLTYASDLSTPGSFGHLRGPAHPHLP